MTDTKHTDSVDLKDIIDLLRGIGSGVFNRDPLAHADNVIEEAVEIRDKAIAALATLQAHTSQQVENWHKESFDRGLELGQQQVEEAVRTARSLELETLAVHLDRQLAGYTSVDLGSIYKYIQQRQEALTPNHQD